MTLDIAGSISAAEGLAVQFGAAGDALILRTGFAIDGIVDGSDGTDAITLTGTSSVRSSSQIVGDTRNCETLLIESGYWTTAARSTVGAITILDGAALEFSDEDAASLTGLEGTAILNEDLVVLNTGRTLVLSEVAGASLTGTGDVQLTAGGTIVADTDLIYTGTTLVTDGMVHLTGSVAGNVRTERNGVFQNYRWRRFPDGHRQ